MAGFTEDEIQAELQRRAEAIDLLDHQRRNAPKDTSSMDTRCLHCGSPKHSWQATDIENPLCELCLHG